MPSVLVGTIRVTLALLKSASFLANRSSWPWRLESIFLEAERVGTHGMHWILHRRFFRFSCQKAHLAASDNERWARKSWLRRVVSLSGSSYWRRPSVTKSLEVRSDVGDTNAPSPMTIALALCDNSGPDVQRLTDKFKSQLWHPRTVAPDERVQSLLVSSHASWRTLCFVNCGREGALPKHYRRLRASSNG